MHRINFNFSLFIRSKSRFYLHLLVLRCRSLSFANVFMCSRLYIAMSVFVQNMRINAKLICTNCHFPFDRYTRKMLHIAHKQENPTTTRHSVFATFFLLLPLHTSNTRHHHTFRLVPMRYLSCTFLRYAHTYIEINSSNSSSSSKTVITEHSVCVCARLLTIPLRRCYICTRKL